ncbi:MAG: hypothetical protein HC899_06880 [Leptolyngbyaceae cyanobacterium SM1_4_3]|nr:hypothetical protein [Leptolyngbyaceae cyanobacterium SM1_4_3]NJN92203.1 hypothetical protein [Leptolyngbyaceae cyanobacterium SL_5_14]
MLAIRLEKGDRNVADDPREQGYFIPIPLEVNGMIPVPFELAQNQLLRDRVKSLIPCSFTKNRYDDLR